MPLFCLDLAARLCGVEADHPFTCNVKEWIKSQCPLIAQRRVIGPLEPGLHVPFSYPGPRIVAVQLCCLIEIDPGFLDIVRKAAPWTALGIGDGNEPQIRLASHDQRFGRMWIQLRGVGRELNLLPKVWCLKCSFKVLFRSNDR